MLRCAPPSTGTQRISSTLPEVSFRSVVIGTGLSSVFEALADDFLDGAGPVVAALGPEADKRFELRRVAREERVRQPQQRTVESVAGDQSQLAIDQGDAAGKIIDRRLQCLRLLADRCDVGADRYEALDLAVAIEARDDDGFEPHVGAAFCAIAQLATPGAARRGPFPTSPRAFRCVCWPELNIS